MQTTGEYSKTQSLCVYTDMAQSSKNHSAGDADCVSKCLQTIIRLIRKTRDSIISY